MSAPRKRWDDHSAKWRRQAIIDGLSKARWDAWFNLSPSARKDTDPRRYAAGQSVAQQRRSTIENAVTDKMLSLSAESSERTIRKGIAEMSSRQLRWTLKADAHRIRRRATQGPSDTTTRNPWWYR